MNEAAASGRGGEPEAPGQGEPGFPADISQLIVAASTDGVIAVDHEGMVRLCNQAAAELFGRPARDMVGTPFGFPIVPGRSADVDLVLRGGGTRAVEMRELATTVEAEPLHIVVLRDISRRRKAERELEATVEQQNIVVGVAAHELHNPLAALSALAYVLQNQQETMTPAERADLTDRIVERITRLQSIVRRLLTASRIDAAGVRALPERVPVLEAIIEQLAEAMADSGKIQVSCSSELAVLADRAEFSIMLANYLDNALAYGTPPIEIAAAERNGRVEIRVTDHGPGVPESFVPHLFERFTRAPGMQQKVEGTGLGLWIGRTYAHVNGGDAWYEPAGEGSCFCLRLPLAPPSLDASTVPGRA